MSLLAFVAHNKNGLAYGTLKEKFVSSQGHIEMQIDKRPFSVGLIVLNVIQSEAVKAFLLNNSSRMSITRSLGRQK
jgi:hypothetical protein